VFYLDLVFRIFQITQSTISSNNQHIARNILAMLFAMLPLKVILKGIES